MKILSRHISLTWIKSKMIRLNDEKGAETIEWIAMVAVILVLLMSVSSIFDDKGTSLAEQIIAVISQWVHKLFISIN